MFLGRRDNEKGWENHYEIVIIKLLDKSIDYFVMIDKIKGIWKSSNSHDIIDIGRGYEGWKTDMPAAFRPASQNSTKMEQGRVE